MDLDKICVVLIVLFTFVGVACGEEAWITYNDSSVRFSHLTATIHVHVKNNNDHVEYFKISQQYYHVEPTLNWTVTGSTPPANKMINTVFPGLGGDWGWKVNPGETKHICFTVAAHDLMGPIPTKFLGGNDTIENQFWPLIPEPGTPTSFFLPNELEYLNPNLDMQLWQGTFTFLLTNVESQTVKGIVRAPIVPVNSNLTSSSPKASFLDDLMGDKTSQFADIAAWDVCMAPHSSRWFTYTYTWPRGTSHSGPASAKSGSITTTSTAKKTSSVPNKETGVPYALLVIGGLIAAAGLLYAKTMR